MVVHTLVAVATYWCKFDNLFLSNDVIFSLSLLQSSDIMILFALMQS